MSSSEEDNIIIQTLLEGPSTTLFSSSSKSTSSEESESDPEPRKKRIKIQSYIENVVALYDEQMFKMHFRMSRKTAYDLIARFDSSSFKPSYVSGRKNISGDKTTLLVLWYLANKNSFREVSDRFDVSLDGAHKCLKRFLEFLMSLKNNIIVWPDSNKKAEISKEFSYSGIHGAIGVIDGSHIEIKKPVTEGDCYINRKGYASLLLQGIVDHKKKFIDVFCGEPGSIHDARLLRKSTIYASILSDPSIMGNYFLLGDSAYPNTDWLITPFKDNGFLSEEQKVFNIKFSSKRIVVEHAFGLLKSRFRRIRCLENFDLQLCSKIIMGACVLHNICLNENDYLENIETNDLNQPNHKNFQNNPNVQSNQSRQLEVFNNMFKKQ